MTCTVSRFAYCLTLGEEESIDSSKPTIRSIARIPATNICNPRTPGQSCCTSWTKPEFAAKQDGGLPIWAAGVAAAGGRRLTDERSVEGPRVQVLKTEALDPPFQIDQDHLDIAAELP